MISRPFEVGSRVSICFVCKIFAIIIYHVQVISLWKGPGLDEIKLNILLTKKTIYFYPELTIWIGCIAQRARFADLANFSILIVLIKAFWVWKICLQVTRK